MNVFMMTAAHHNCGSWIHLKGGLTVSNEPRRIDIDVDEDGVVEFVFYRDDGCICASAGLLSDGVAFAHILDGTNFVAREWMSPEEISEAASIAADAP